MSPDYIDTRLHDIDVVLGRYRMFRHLTGRDRTELASGIRQMHKKIMLMRSITLLCMFMAAGLGIWSYFGGPVRLWTNAGLFVVLTMIQAWTYFRMVMGMQFLEQKIFLMDLYQRVIGKEDFSTVFR